VEELDGFLDFDFYPKISFSSAIFSSFIILNKENTRILAVLTIVFLLDVKMEN
jgi:hypothetical protein